MEIKFRIWDYQNDEMIYGVGITPESDTYIPYKMTDSDESFENFNYYPKSSLMQFTGVKDENEIPIYSGDVIYSQLMDEKEIFIDEVKFKGGQFILSTEGRLDIPLGHDNITYIEIAGNFFENPELLGEGEII